MFFGFHGHRHRDFGDRLSMRHAMHGRGRHGGFGRHGDSEQGWGGGDGFGRGRRGRLFDGGELRLVLLSLIAEQPRHGYDLIRALEERSGGAYAPSPGVVYPTLTLLGDMEQIVEAPGTGNRRTFEATEAGRAALAEAGETVASLLDRLDALARMQARTDAGPVRRSIMNLREAVAQAARNGDRDTAHAIAGILDEAAQRIERL